MKRSTLGVLGAGILVAAAACSSDSTSPTSTSPLLAAAFMSTPAGFSSTDNSFASSSDLGEAWKPDRNARDDGGMMGGGLRPEFFGGIPLARGWDRGPFGLGDFPFICVFSTTDSRVTCPSVTRGGLTINRSFQFKDASGNVQQVPGSTTNTINEKVTVNGTVTRHDGNVTSTVNESSDRTVSGLAAGSTERTVNGTATGTENSTGKTDDGTSFTSTRTVNDAVTGLKIPLQDGHPTFPSAGTIVRSMSVTLTVSGKPAVTSSRSETITFDGSKTAQVVITKNGTTKKCTIEMPFGHLQCP